MLKASKGKRNKILTIVLLPALISIFLMGWALYSMGYQKKNYSTQNKLQTNDHVTFMPMVFEKPLTI